jgi:hypothetical protein
LVLLLLLLPHLGQFFPELFYLFSDKNEGGFQIRGKKITACISQTALSVFCLNPFLVMIYIAKGILQRFVIPLLPVIRILSRVPMEYVTFRALIICNDDPIMPGGTTVDCGVVVVQLENVI